MKSNIKFFKNLNKKIFTEEEKDEFFCVNMRVIMKWLLSNEPTDISKYLCKVYTGLVDESTVIWYPVSYGDFARCYDFLSLLSEDDAKKLLKQISSVNSIWETVYNRYDELLCLYKLGDVENFSKIINPVVEKYHQKS